MAWNWNARQSRATADGLIRDLQTVPLADLPKKIEQMAPYRGWVVPSLRDKLRDEPPGTETGTRILLALLPVEPDRATDLARRLLTCEPEEHRIIREALRGHWSLVTPRLRRVLDAPSALEGQRTRAAAALIALDGPDTPAANAWDELRLAADPGPSVELLEWLVQSKVDPGVLINHLDVETDGSVRQTSIQCLADLTSEPVSAATLAHLPRFVSMYRDDPDSGIHSSIAYLLKRWGHADTKKAIDAELTGKARGKRRWLVNSHGQTMAVIGVDDDIVSKTSAARRLPYRLAITTTEITLEQYLKHVPGHLTTRRESGLPDLSSPELAVEFVSYDKAAAYCNWLSEKEGLPQDQCCYLPGDKRGKMVMAPDYLRRRGYRLPNLDEWEYAARAGTSTDRYFGRSLAYAGRYVWYRKNTDNHVEIVGLKRPNSLGMCDILGNVAEWCFNPNPSHHPSCKCKAAPGEACSRVRPVSQRGGSFSSTVEAVAAQPNLEFQDQLTPWEQYPYIGFRVVKLAE